MKKTTRKNQRKGTAIIVAVLLAAIIGTAAIGIVAIAFRQLNIANTYSNGISAYYAAESGLEQGLLYNKFDKNMEVPENVGINIFRDSLTLRDRPANAYRNFLTKTPMRTTISNDGVTFGYTARDRSQVYELQSYYLQSNVGSDINTDGKITGHDLDQITYSATYKITKDNAMSFSMINSTDPIWLYWRWLNSSCGSTRALEVKVKNTSGDERTALFGDPATSCSPTNADQPDKDPASTNYSVYTPQNGASLQTKMNISTWAITEMTLKPVGGINTDGILFGFYQGSQTATNNRYTSNLETTIQSIGYYFGTSRQIIAKINRQTGTILDIFNYAFYRGQ